MVTIWISLPPSGSLVSGGSMVEELTRIQRLLLQAYVRSRFVESDLQPDPCLDPVDGAPPEQLKGLVCRIGGEVQRNHADLFQAMVTELNPTATTAYQQFVGVTAELFRDGVSWGRIVSLYVFCGELAVYCAQRDESLAGYVKSVLEWESRFFQQKIAPWMVEHNGWVSALAHDNILLSLLLLYHKSLRSLFLRDMLTG